MRHLNKNMLRIVYVILLGVLLTFSATAAEELEDTLQVYTTESSAPQWEDQGGDEADLYFRSAGANFTAGSGALELIKQFEGFYAQPYQDTSWTAIGYGTPYSKAQEKYPGCTSVTQEQALELVKDELATVETKLNAYLNKNGITVNQNQFDALADFTYNVGTGWLYSQNSDGTPYQIRALLEGDSAQWTSEKVQAAFGSWVKAGGVVLQGLVKRRAAEAALFMTPVSTGSAPAEDTTDNVFQDLKTGAWYVEYVLEANQRGIMTGKGNGIFDPDAQMTRAEMVMALAKLDGVDLSGYTTSAFTDVPSDSWYAAAVAWAAEKGYVNGTGDGTFLPGEPIKREHICSIVARYLRSKGVTQGSTQLTFTDEGDMEATAKENIYFCASLNIVNGVDGGGFAPKQQATRSQLAKILVCVDRLLNG